MANGAATDIGLRHFAHLNGSLHPGIHILLLQGILQGKGIHNGCQHAHVISRSAIHALRAAGQAAPDIAAAHNDCHIYAAVADLLHLGGDILHHFRIDAKALGSCQGLAGKLQDNAFIFSCIQGNPSRYKFSLPFIITKSRAIIY